MEARFYDGRTGQPQTVILTIADGGLRFVSQDGEHVWPLAAIAEEHLSDLARLSWSGDSDARLLVQAAAWRLTRGPGSSPRETARRGRERGLVLGLTALGLGVVLFVFVLVPAVSGPLARATPPAFERSLGESFEAQLNLGLRPCKGSEGQGLLLALGDRIEGRDGEPFNIRVEAVQAPFANAFALPGGAILVTDDLIREARTPEELSAVVAHEVAHVEKRHVMQAVWRNLGLGIVLDAVVGGGTGAGQQAVLLVGNAADLRFSRQAEAEADAYGMELLHAADLSSMGMASFFERMAADGGGKGQSASAVQEFISSHPDTHRRVSASRARQRPGEPFFTDWEWAAVKATCDLSPAKAGT